MADEDMLQDLMAGLALDNLDDDERLAAQKLLGSNLQAQDAFKEYQELTNWLALSVEPRELPQGSLGRLRQKVGVIERQTNPLPFPSNKAMLGETPKIRFKTPFRFSTLVYAAAILLFFTTMLFGFLWLDANNKASKYDANSRELTALLASPRLIVTDLKNANGAGANGTWRLYTDPNTDKAILVAHGLPAVSSDKEYEAWLITDKGPQKAALVGSGGTNQPVLVELDTKGNVEAYKLVAITVELKGGVDVPTQQPILMGVLS